MVTNRSTGIPKLRISGGIDRVVKNAGMEVTPRALKMLEPMTLPIAMSALPFLAAMVETTNSGREMPMATAVIAISSGLMWRR